MYILKKEYYYMKGDSMKKVMLAALSMVLSLGIMLSASGVQAAKEERVFYSKMGKLDVWILAPCYNDMSTSVLQPHNDVEKKAITKAYPTGKARNAHSVMLVRGKGYVALVDAGHDEDTPLMLKLMEQVGVKPTDITHIILTHGHADHVGSLVHKGVVSYPKARISIGAAEYDFWSNASNKADVPDRMHKTFDDFAEVVNHYGIDRIQPHKFFLDGLSLLPVPGHTPGHMAVLVEPNAKGKGLVFFGDAVHGALAQVPQPGITTVYDLDAAKAAASRIKLFEKIAKKGWDFSGSHMPGVQPWAAKTLGGKPCD